MLGLDCGDREVDAGAEIQLGRKRRRSISLRPQRKSGQCALIPFTAFQVGPIQRRLCCDSAQPLSDSMLALGLPGPPPPLSAWC